ncbi:MAG: glycosyltransferase family 39 protein [Sumerlaeia bacterium]
MDESTRNRSKGNAQSRTNWLWAAFFLFLAFAFWGGRPISETSEGRYAEAAREMFAAKTPGDGVDERGNWLVPAISGQPHLTKPALTYWAINGGMAIFGVNAYGARFAHALAFLGTIGCVFLLGRMWGFRRSQALAACLVYATAVMPFATGRVLTTDGLLVFFETLGVLGAWGVWSGARRAGLWRGVFWLAFALAFLTKGPPSWLPILALIAYWAASGRNTSLRGRLFFHPITLVYLPLFLLLSFSWYLMVIQEGHATLGYFLGDELRDRVLTDEHDRNNPPWIYLAVLALGLGPWSVLWPRLARKIWSHKSGTGLGTRLRGLAPWQVFSLFWFVLPLTVFLLSKSRLPLYVAPLFVPLCLAMGKIAVDERWPWFQRQSPGRRRLLLGAGAVWVLGLVLMTADPAARLYNRTYKDFGERLAASGLLADPSVRPYFTFGDARTTVQFYAGRAIPALKEGDGDDFSGDEVMLFDHELARSGLRGIYITKESRRDEVDDYERATRLLIETEELVAFEFVREVADSHIPRLKAEEAARRLASGQP